MIILKDVIKNYRKQIVLDIPDLKIEENDILGIIGANGSGKTTLAEIILGTKKVTKGKVSYQDDITKIKRNAVFQESSFDSELNLEKLFGFYQKLFHANKNLEEEFNTFNLNHLKKKHYDKLSGGEKQRFKLMIALINDPDLILFDEISNSLDLKTKKWIINIVKKNDKNQTILMISHEPEEIFTLCNRVIKLEHGKIIKEIKTKQITKKIIEDLMEND